jgi:hypothetical protein
MLLILNSEKSISDTLVSCHRTNLQSRLTNKSGIFDALLDTRFPGVS